MPDTPRLIAHPNLPYGFAGEHPLYLDVLSAPPDDGRPLLPVVWVHGGAWEFGDRRTTPNQSLAEAGFFTVSLQYRFGPEAPHPAQIHDVKAAIRWVRENAAQFGAEPSRVGIWGHSAGGHLAALAATTNHKPEFAVHSGTPEQDASVQCAIPISPPLDFLHDWYAASGLAPQQDDYSAVHSLLGCYPWENRARAAHASPHWQADANAAPQLVIHGEADDIVPVPQVFSYRSWLRHQGAICETIIVPGGDHVTMTDPLYPGAPDPLGLRDRCIAFFRRHLTAAP